MAKRFVAITVERCKGCAFSVEFCPTQVLTFSSAFNSKCYHPPFVAAPDKSSGCDLCGMYCPDFASPASGPGGGILAAAVIGKAKAIYQGDFATMTQNFGPEARGGA